jgi:hypothetical protein
MLILKTSQPFSFSTWAINKDAIDMNNFNAYATKHALDLHAGSMFKSAIVQEAYSGGLIQRLFTPVTNIRFCDAIAYAMLPAIPLSMWMRVLFAARSADERGMVGTGLNMKRDPIPLHIPMKDVHGRFRGAFGAIVQSLSYNAISATINATFEKAKLARGLQDTALRIGFEFAKGDLFGPKDVMYTMDGARMSLSAPCVDTVTIYIEADCDLNGNVSDRKVPLFGIPLYAIERWVVSHCLRLCRRATSYASYVNDMERELPLQPDENVRYVNHEAFLGRHNVKTNVSSVFGIADCCDIVGMDHILDKVAASGADLMVRDNDEIPLNLRLTSDEWDFVGAQPLTIVDLDCDRPTPLKTGVLDSNVIAAHTYRNIQPKDQGMFQAGFGLRANVTVMGDEIAISGLSYDAASRSDYNMHVMNQNHDAIDRDMAEISKLNNVMITDSIDMAEKLGLLYPSNDVFGVNLTFKFGKE